MSVENTMSPRVHRRTVKGQSAVVSGCTTLSLSQQRVLRLFNGFTPTEWLLAIAEHILAQPEATIEHLEEQGYIALVGESAP
jgi:hypothetical protein